MSIRYGLLALLERGPMYGYQLRVAFEESTGATWPLNIGQVYTTLARLERDDLVEEVPESPSGQRTYRITDAGRRELTSWFSNPVGRDHRPRDELAIKLALAVTTPGVDVAAVVQAQRTANVQTLQELTRMKTTSSRTEDLPWLLVLDSMIFRVEAETRWLDHCEARLVRHRPAGSAVPAVRPADHREAREVTR